MAELDPLELTTRKEKIVVAVAALISIIAHIVLVFGGFKGFWPEREKKDKRMMIVRRLPENIPEIPSEEQDGASAKKLYEKKPGEPEKEKKPEPPPKKKGEEPEEGKTPPPKPPEEKPKAPETAKKENGISIYTDLNEATFRLEGPVAYRGAGTFWEKKGLPPGDYRVTFGAVAGYGTPPPQADTLPEGGGLTFVGRYTKMIQVSVDTNLDGAKYKIIRPDGRELDLSGRQGLFKDLPRGTYTIVFGDLPGMITPESQTRQLEPGGQLSFSGYYSPYGTGSGLRPGQGSGKGTVLAKGTREKKSAEPPARKTAVLDRRIKMVVTSDPPTSIETYYGAVRYPEAAIQSSNYQEGWCQVYLVVAVDSDGRITDLQVARPSEEERERYAPLIQAVEESVRGWDFDRKATEVQVDVRFYVEK